MLKPIHEKYLDENGEIHPWLQHAYLYDLHWQFQKKVRPAALANQADYNQYIADIVAVLQFIADKTILESDRLNELQMQTVLYLKHNGRIPTANHFLTPAVTENDIKFGNNSKNSLGRVRVEINGLHVMGNSLYLMGTIVAPFPVESLSFRMVNQKQQSINLKRVNNVHDKHYFFGEPMNVPFSFSAEINTRFLRNSERLFFLMSYGDINRKIHMSLGHLKNVPFNKMLSDSAYVQVGDRLITYSDEKKELQVIEDTKATRQNLENAIIEKLTASKRFKNIEEITELRKKALFQKRLNKLRKRTISLYSDKVDRADDNGEVLIQYANQHKKIGKQHLVNYFVIKEDSPDFLRLKKLGIKVVPYGSEQHKLLWMQADNIISSQANDTEWNPFWSKDGYRFSLNLNNQPKRIFLQHGIIAQKDVSEWVRRGNKELSLFVTSTKEEYATIINPENGYEYDEKAVILTGLPRHDRLTNFAENKAKRTIVIAPTMRHYLDQFVANGAVIEEKSESVAKSPYFVAWSQAIAQLRDKLVDTDVELKLLVHPSVRPLASYFGATDEELLAFDARYVDVINASDAVITDFSSLAFDFAIVNKAVMYFDFAENAGGWDTALERNPENTLGEVATNVEALVENTLGLLEGDFHNPAVYATRATNFFAFQDHNNSKRVFNKIYGEK